MNELDDKEWKTNQSVISEKITDLTSKVKNILDGNAEADGASNGGLSEDDRDDGYHKNSTRQNQSNQKSEFKSSGMKTSNTISGINTGASNRIDPMKLKKPNADKKPIPKINLNANSQKIAGQDFEAKVFHF